MVKFWAKKLWWVVVIVTGILIACQPSTEQLVGPVSQTVAAIPTQTAYPTYTLPATQTARVITKIVTITFTPTPEFTPTNTLPPTKTQIPSPTISPLALPHGPGVYLVGIDIEPGVWRNNSSNDNCYWKITTKTDDIINNYYGMGGGTMYIPSNGFQVIMEKECGKWIYLGK